MTARDQKTLWMTGNNPSVQWDILSRFRDRQARRWSALRDLADDDGSLSVAESGVAGNWEFPGYTSI